MKNIIITLAVLVIPFFSGAQTLFFHPVDYNLSLDQEWRVVHVTDGFVSEEVTVSFSHLLIFTEINKKEGVLIFNHYVDNKLTESFTYDVSNSLIFPQETEFTQTAVEP